MTLNLKPDEHAQNAQSRLKVPLKPLKKADYPNVKFWDRQRHGKTEYTAIRVAASDDDDGDLPSDSERDDKIVFNKREKNKIFSFLENDDGEPITLAEKDALYSEVRGWWNENIDTARVPQNWSSAGTTLRDRFRNDIEEKFPFLRLCSGHWKVDAIWKKNYHSWKTTFHSRVRKEQKSAQRSDSSSESDHTKQHSSGSFEREKESIGDDFEDPRPKKKLKHGIEKVTLENVSQSIFWLFSC